MVRLMSGKRVVGLRHKRRPVGRKARRATDPFAKRVLAVLKRQEETKYVANDYSAAGTPNGSNWLVSPTLATLGDFIPAIPQLTQGTGDFERIGAKVSPMKVSATLKIGFEPMDLSSNSLIGVIYYGTSKTEKTWQNANPLPTPAILDNGDGTVSSWTGTRAQLNCPIDKQTFNMKRIVFRLSKTAGLQNSDVATGAANGNMSTSNGLSEKSFTLNFKPPKTLTYGATANLYPQNYAPFYAISFCHADGSAATVGDRNLVTVSSKVHMTYKDS